MAGQADLISNVPIEDIERIAKHPRIRIEKVVGFRMYFLGMNVTLKPFDNKLVRQAVNYAVDREAIVNVFGSVKGSTAVELPKQLKRS